MTSSMKMLNNKGPSKNPWSTLLVTVFIVEQILSMLVRLVFCGWYSRTIFQGRRRQIQSLRLFSRNQVQALCRMPTRINVKWHRRFAEILMSMFSNDTDLKFSTRHLSTFLWMGGTVAVFQVSGIFLIILCTSW